MEFRRDNPYISKLLKELRQDNINYLFLDLYAKQNLGLDDETLVESYAKFFVDNKLTDCARNNILSQKILQYGKDISDKDLKKLIREGNIDERIAKYQINDLKNKKLFAFIGFISGAIMTNLSDILNLLKTLLHKIH